MTSPAIAPARDRSNEAILELIAAGRERFAKDFGAAPSAFDAPSWDIASLKDRSIDRSNRRAYFTRHGTTDQALPPVYAEVVKSWIVLERRSTGNLGCRVDAARILWEAVLKRRRGESAAFRWESLQDEDLSQAELLMRIHWSDSRTHKMTVMLLVLTRFLAARGICRGLYYTPQTPRVEDLNRHTIAGQVAGRDRLPSDAALQGLADIYREHATEPRDRLRIAAVAILVVTGFRIGELLTLPLDCEVEELRNGKQRYGLRYYKEKARGGERMFAVRWLTDVGAELARKAIGEIGAITAEARAQARVLEQAPHRVAIPGFQGTARMTSLDVARAVGMTHKKCVYQIPGNRLPRHQDSQGSFYRAFEVEEYVKTLRVKRLWTLDRRDGTHQMLSETLLIAFRNFFHPGRGTCPLVIEPVLIQQISDFLSHREASRSVFERFNIREEDGSICRVTSHQFRHWLNYIADKGGLPTELQTRWMGREHSRDTDAYRHATVDERLEWVKQGIQADGFSGPKADMYQSLPPARKAAFLDGEVHAVHVTAFGICLHDFAVAPCPYHLNCVRGCADYLRTNGSARERRHLIQIQDATERTLSSARSHAAKGNMRIAEPWIRHCEETLAGVKRALAVDDDVNESGPVVRAFPDGRSRFKVRKD